MLYELKLLDGTAEGELAVHDFPGGTVASGYAAAEHYEESHPGKVVRSWRSLDEDGEPTGSWIST